MNWETDMRKYQRNGGVAMKHLFAMKDKDNGNVVITQPYGEHVATFPSHLSNKPDYRNKYVTINCVDYILKWVNK
jgi:hypothetical protein